MAGVLVCDPSDASCPSSTGGQALVVGVQDVRADALLLGECQSFEADLPLIHTLILSLHLGSQARLRALPRIRGDGENGVFRVQKGQQTGTIQVALDRSDATTAVMPKLRARLLHILLTAVAILAQFALSR
jgi:hypothetical protein